eukprot:1858840-Rhodomonas_salina.1
MQVPVIALRMRNNRVGLQGEGHLGGALNILKLHIRKPFGLVGVRVHRHENALTVLHDVADFGVELDQHVDQLLHLLSNQHCQVSPFFFQNWPRSTAFHDKNGSLANSCFAATQNHTTAASMIEWGRVSGVWRRLQDRETSISAFA